MQREGQDTDGKDTPSILEEKEIEATGGLSTGLQPGGTIPGSGPGTMKGAIGTGGGSDADRDTGNLKKSDEGEEAMSR